MKKGKKLTGVFSAGLIAAGSVLSAGLMFGIKGSELVEAAAGDVTINSSTFPDTIFRDYVKQNFDKNKDNILTVSEQKAVGSIAVGKMGITSVQGIEYFTELINLWAGENAITSVDVSKNTKLVNLYLQNNKITSIDVRSNRDLQRLHLRNNNLASIDVGQNTQLIGLWLDNNEKISTLYVGNNKQLQYLWVNVNNLSQIDVRSNAALKELHVAYNKLTNLDVSQNPNLINLYCSGNNLSVLNLSANPRIERLECGWQTPNKIKVLDLSKQTNINFVQCPGNALTNLDLSNNPGLTRLECNHNNLVMLDLSKNKKISEAKVGYQTRTVTSSGGAISLTAIDSALNANNVTVTSGAVKSGTNLTNISKTIKYDYATGCGDIKMDVTLTTDLVEATGVTMGKTTASIAKGATETLAATVVPTNATNKTLTWTSSNPSVATVDSDGKVTAISEGQSTITVKTSNGKQATCLVTVTKSGGGGEQVDPTSFTFTNPPANLDIGEQHTVTTNLAPSNATTTWTWTSSNPSVATVDNNGTITAVSPGSTVITAKTGNNITKSFTLTVKAKKPTSIILNNSSLTVKPGESQTLTAAIDPADADSTLIWSSSNPSVATVNSSGKVTGVGVGKAVITARSQDGKIFDSCIVDVKIPAENVTVNNGDGEISTGGTHTINVTVNPTNYTEKIRFESSDPTIATVDDKGNVKGLKPGTVTIYILGEDGRLLGSTTFTVKNTAVSGISLAPSSSTIKYQGNTLQLKATVYPSNASNKKVTWTSSNKNIATVNGSGKVTAVKQGVVTITAQTSDGGKKATSKIRVLFDDVQQGHKFYNPIYWAADNKVTVGVEGTNLFKPENNVTRGQVVAFLYRMNGNPSTVGSRNKFSDVTPSSTFWNPILWGGTSTVVAGYPDGTFREGTVCSRGQIVALLWRYAGRPEPSTKTSPFPDVKKNHTFFKAIMWAYERGITTGTSDGRFAPQDPCTRGQMMAFIRRFANLYPSKFRI